MIIVIILNNSVRLGPLNIIYSKTGRVLIPECVFMKSCDILTEQVLICFKVDSRIHHLYHIVVICTLFVLFTCQLNHNYFINLHVNLYCVVVDFQHLFFNLNRIFNLDFQFFNQLRIPFSVLNIM